MDTLQRLSAALAPTDIQFRPIVAEDMAFLCQVYASTRLEELAVTDWSAEQKQAFLVSQFQAQHTYYQEHYRDAAFLLILRTGQPIGRLYLDQWQDQLRIIDIALLPAYRGQGIGTHILSAVVAEGQRIALPVSIHVERFNPALSLYTRLGFRQVADKGVYYLLEKTPYAR